MKTPKLLLAILSLALLGAPVRADTKPTMVVQVVQTEDGDAYAALLAQANTLVKARAGIDKLRHLWIGYYAGPNTRAYVVVSEFPSAAAIANLAEKMKNYPEMDVVMGKFKTVRKLGNSYLYKAVRYEGGYDGGAVFNTSLKVTDEAGYLKALDGLRAILDANGFKDAKLNLWRIISGRTESTHLVVIALPSQLRVDELLDTINDNNLLAEWNVGASKFRTSLSNATWHEITK